MTEQEGSRPSCYGEGTETGEAIEEEPGKQPSIQEDWLAVEVPRSPATASDSPASSYVLAPPRHLSPDFAAATSHDAR